MSSYEQSVSLLRANKRAEVEAIRALGFPDVTVETRASLFPTYIRWAHGLLDITVAVRYRGDGPDKGAHIYFTPQEWNSLTATQRSDFVVRGLRLRACARTLIIGLAQQTLALGVVASVTGGQNKFSAPDVFFAENCRELTELLATYNVGREGSSFNGSPAAEFALGYRAFTENYAGFGDDTQWAIPSYSQLRLIYRFRNELNEALQAIGSENILPTSHWSCCVYDTASAYQMSMGSGASTSTQSPSTSCVVRPIAQE